MSADIAAYILEHYGATYYAVPRSAPEAGKKLVAVCGEFLVYRRESRRVILED